MVKWGFPYGDVRNIPIDEVDDYITMINEYYERKNKPQSDGGLVDNNPKMSGGVNPTAF